jgi:hypothetical protein
MGIGETDAPRDPAKGLQASSSCSKAVISNDEIAKKVLAIATIASNNPAAATLLAKKAQPESPSPRFNSKFVRSLAERAEELYPDSTLTAFLKSFSAGDRAGMRSAVHQLATQ